MPVEERRRAALRAAAATSLGQEAADTLMELVTPAGQDPATRGDVEGVLTALDHLDQRWSERLDAMDQRWSQRLGDMDRRLDHMDERWSERLDAMDNRWTERLDTMDRQLKHMDERWEQRAEAMEQRLTANFERGLREAITSQTRSLVVALLVAVVAIAGLAFGLGG